MKRRETAIHSIIDPIDVAAKEHVFLVIISTISGVVYGGVRRRESILLISIRTRANATIDCDVKRRWLSLWDDVC